MSTDKLLWAGVGLAGASVALVAIYKVGGRAALEATATGLRDAARAYGMKLEADKLLSQTLEK